MAEAAAAAPSATKAASAMKAAPSGIQAAPEPPKEKTPEEIKADEQKAAMLAMAAQAADAAASAAAKRKKGRRGKKKKGSWDLLAPKDRQTRFWVEQFARDAAAGCAEAEKLQRLVDKKAEENRVAKENWEKEVKKMLKTLYQMDRKVGAPTLDRRPFDRIPFILCLFILFIFFK